MFIHRLRHQMSGSAENVQLFYISSFISAFRTLKHHLNEVLLTFWNDLITSSFASTLNQNIQTDVLFFCMIICEDGDFLRCTRSRLPRYTASLCKASWNFSSTTPVWKVITRARWPKRNRTQATHRTGCRVRGSVYRLSGIKIKCRFIFFSYSIFSLLLFFESRKLILI